LSFCSHVILYYAFTKEPFSWTITLSTDDGTSDFSYVSQNINNNNRQICIAPLGRNFKGATGLWMCISCPYGKNYI